MRSILAALTSSEQPTWWLFARRPSTTWVALLVTARSVDCCISSGWQQASWFRRSLPEGSPVGPARWAVEEKQRRQLYGVQITGTNQ